MTSAVVFFSCQQCVRDDAVSFGNGVEYVRENTLFFSLGLPKATINVKLYNFDLIDLLMRCFFKTHALSAEGILSFTDMFA